MRSSKSRSRNKNNNRNRSSGNNLNRVFDSSGPEGKVRGTPQQIIEKYSQLARDATLGNDRVAAENFMQHSEHYARMHAEAQREMDAKREAQEREHRDRQQTRADQNRQNHQGDQLRGDQHQGQQHQPQQNQQNQQSHAADLGGSAQPDLAPAMALQSDSGLVETPEQAAPVKKPRAPRKPKAAPASEPKAEVVPDDTKAAE